MGMRLQYWGGNDMGTRLHTRDRSDMGMSLKVLEVEMKWERSYSTEG